MSKTVLSAVKRCLAAAAMVVAAGGAQASLVGASTTCAIVPSPIWACNTGSAAVVDPGVEYRLLLGGNNFFSVDISADALLLTLISTGGLSMNAGEIATFGGLTSATGVASFLSAGEAGFDLTDVSLAGGTLSLNLNGSSWRPGDTALIRFNVANAVPEPTTLSLLGLALAAAGFARRRQA